MLAGCESTLAIGPRFHGQQRYALHHGGPFSLKEMDGNGYCYINILF